MNVKRYFAPTAPEVLLAVRKDLGTDAVVLACWAREGGVEVLAEPAQATPGSAPSHDFSTAAVFSGPDRPCRGSWLAGQCEAHRRLSGEEASLMLAGSGRGD